MSYKILAKRELCTNQYELTIDAPYVVVDDTTKGAYYSPITYTVTFDPNGGTGG